MIFLVCTFGIFAHTWSLPATEHVLSLDGSDPFNYDNYDRVYTSDEHNSFEGALSLLETEHAETAGLEYQGFLAKITAKMKLAYQAVAEETGAAGKDDETDNLFRLGFAIETAPNGDERSEKCSVESPNTETGISD